MISPSHIERPKTGRGTQVAALVILAIAAFPAALAYVVFLGLGLHRHAPSWAISACTTMIVFGPALLAGGFARQARSLVFSGVLLGWSIGLLLAMPVYFPGERSQAMVTGLSLVGGGDRWDDFTKSISNTLPGDPDIASPEVPEALAIAEAVLPPSARVDDHQIALPYEGAGRRVSVEITFENGGKTVAAEMMLDTGATYTTLPLSVLEQLGITTTGNEPIIELHTANGQRDARVVLVDKVWLGDLMVTNVAIATCEECASNDTVGLLGLNVTGGYNFSIDADRKEVVFSTREANNRRLDVTPFVDISASLSRFPGGRTEVSVDLVNHAPVALAAAVAEITCRDQSWEVDIGAVKAGAKANARRRLPEHRPCDRYQVALHDATW
jgi:clan AA aspartic protease (TIGR02281 family)